jgi:hypothetical protein
MTRRIRLLASLAALTALAFGQFALAVHACERLGAASEPAVHAGHADCCPDEGRSNQCVEHCKFGAATVDSAKSLPLPAATSGPGIGIPTVLHAGVEPARIAFRVPPTAGPPPPLRFIALRI